MKIQSTAANLAFLIAVSASVGANAATTFTFQFDDSDGGLDGTIAAPLVGSGIFVSPIDLGVGQYALSSLPGFSLQFTFGSDTFSTADIATPISEVAVLISQSGSLERLVFTENGSPEDGGPAGGSLDLLNGKEELSFEPTAFGGHNLYAEFRNINRAPTNVGNYLALSSFDPAPPVPDPPVPDPPIPNPPVPEPATWAMILIGFIGLGYGSIRRASTARLAAARAKVRAGR